MINQEIKVAYMFTGQGSQSLNMWDALSSSAGALEILKISEELAPYLPQLVSEGPFEELTQTKNTQLATLAFDLGSLSMAKEANPRLKEINPDYYLGHSLGELAALVAGRVINERTGLSLSLRRGKIMQEDGGAGCMAAVGADEDRTRKLCEKANEENPEYGTVEVVNLNAPNQMVVSGSKEQMANLRTLAIEEGMGSKLLKVSHAFHHSILMAPAAQKFASVLSEIEFRDPVAPIVLNKTGESSTLGEEIKEIHSEQIASPVRWYQSIEFLLEQGVNTFVEFGPAPVLTGLLKQINSEARGYCVKDFESAKNLGHFFD